MIAGPSKSSVAVTGTEDVPTDGKDRAMPKTSEKSLPLEDFGPVLSRDAELADLAVSFTTFKEETDMAQILAALPTGSCQCPHWGVVRKGGATVRYDDGHEETIETGDLYYMTPGHVPVFQAGTDLIMFSPAAELKATDEAIRAFLASQTPQEV
jgi:hypothetical protein